MLQEVFTRFRCSGCSASNAIRRKDEIRNLSLMFIPLILVLVNAAIVLWSSNSSGSLSGVGLYHADIPPLTSICQ